MGEPISTVGELAGICGHDGDNWEKILIDASKRLVVAIAAFTATLEVTQDTPGDLLTGIHGYISGAWQKQPLQLGYSDVLDVDLGGTATGTSWSANTGAVPAGEIWIVQFLSARNTTRNPSLIQFYPSRPSGSAFLIGYVASPGVNVPLTVNCNMVFAEGDVIHLYIGGTQAGDNVDAGIVGYKMDIDL